MHFLPTATLELAAADGGHNCTIKDEFKVKSKAFCISVYPTTSSMLIIPRISLLSNCPFIFLLGLGRLKKRKS